MATSKAKKFELALKASILDGGTVDSAQTISLITDTVDSGYIQERQVDLVRDSTFITDIITSNYINSRVTVSSGTGTVDSAQTISLITGTITSDYINSRVNATVLGLTGLAEYVFIGDSAQTLFNGYDKDSNLLQLDSTSILNVFINGIKLLSSDYSISNNSITLLEPSEQDDEVIILKYETVDSSYVSSSQQSPQILDFGSLYLPSGQIKFRRSEEADRLNIILAEGEPIFITDTKQLYVGDGITAGGILIGPDSAYDNGIEIINGGYPTSQTFDVIIDGGLYSSTYDSTVDPGTIDGFTAYIEGGTPSTISFESILEGGTPSTLSFDTQIDGGTPIINE